ncbi:MAG: chemotaxis protein CheX [Desulfobacterales bacterium]|nr:chemotaxis protein CheX [Desulfobacterales bacterium]
MDAVYIKPFVDAVENLFNTMLDLPFALEKPYIKKEPVPEYEIAGIIGMSGGVSGCVVINMRKSLALQLVSELLDEEMTELDDDCIDAIGEIANMIAGNAKTDFPDENCSISVPSVVIGNHKTSYPHDIEVISIPCKAGNGKLVIDVAIKKNT